MSEQKRERREKVYLRNAVWLENAEARAQKIPQGCTVLMTADEIEHFGDKVTKDIPKGAPEHERE